MISTKGRYALRVMLDLAQQDEGIYVPLKDIAERQQISKKYLEIIVKDLVKAKLVKASSGKGGGYMLSRGAGEYSVGEILEATEGSLASVACLAGDEQTCPRAESCPTLPMWIEFDKMARDFFYSKKLTDLNER
ncbi:MAG: Rrf2 family transcriptional regulator [Clostridia bacterium]|nr:Rrf2 family transcriptional regulator [Clostridia bacterium]MBR5427519.1 Rrf2 family transcriptional regulator [Clostridia bacterium]